MFDCSSKYNYAVYVNKIEAKNHQTHLKQQQKVEVDDWWSFINSVATLVFEKEELTC